MSAANAAHSVVEPSAAAASGSPAASLVVVLYALITMIPLLWIFADQLQDAARFDRLSAEDPVPAQPRRLLQPVHHAHPPDAGIHQLAAAGDVVLR